MQPASCETQSQEADTRPLFQHLQHCHEPENDHEPELFGKWQRQDRPVNEIP